MNICKTAGVFTCVIYLQAIAVGQTSFWTNSSVPVNPGENDSASVTLGLNFSSDVPGSVTGIRFYKGSHNTGTHVGNLWSSTGSKLASVTFSGETASGWQQANFSSPVAIAANTTYVLSYLAPNGNYADDANYAWSSLSAKPLHVSGSSPGVYAYGSSPTFPTGRWNASNYWVDPVFVAASNPSTVSSMFWTNSTNPSTAQVGNDTASVTLGLKFYSDVPGSVTAVRFYKGTNNTGTHVGTLWSSTGTKLAEITFSGETASGWQQANLSSPVNIAANTSYVISYLAPKGSYANDQYYLWGNLSAAPLHVSGSAPGVYAYGPTSTFPTGTWNGSNYWVDLVFTSGSSSNPGSYTISGSVSGSAATLTLSGAATGSTATDATGKYMFSGLANGSYVVTANQSGYTFAPPTASVTVNGGAITGVNFTATAVQGSHSVTLSWTASPSSSIVGYNVYRGSTSGGPYTQVGFVGGTSYVDANVSSGQTYYYVATAVDANNEQSVYSTQSTAAIPIP